MSRTVKKLPADLDIFLLSTLMWPLCIQYLANGLPVAPSDWAISFSWCGKMRSTPPQWMSKVSPRYFMLMAEHSMCQPGRPMPHGLFHAGSPGFCAFQRAKSMGWRFMSPTSTRAPLSRSSRFWPESLP